jgi:hypothetical protein
MRPGYLVIAVLTLQAPLCADAPPDDRTGFVRSVTVAKGEQAFDVICILCPVRVHGTATGDVIAIGGDVEVAGSVGGDVVALGGRVRVLAGARVGGEATAIGGRSEVSAGARVGGEREEIPFVHVPGQRSLHPLAVVSFLAGNLLLIAVAALILPGRTKHTGAAILKHPAWSFLAGLALSVFWVLLLDLRTPRWIRPLGWLVHTALLAGLYLGYVGVAWAIGAVVRRTEAERLPVWLPGALLLTVGMLIPIAGSFLFLVALILSLGAAVISRLGRAPRAKS